jgi:predicted SprT family Zn-dependent metalloprotease
MILDAVDDATKMLVCHYVARLALPVDRLWITTNRRQFERWLGRRVQASIGGAYVYHPLHKAHLVLINVPRINLEQPKALEIVVAEELLHMRDFLDGDRRRHAKHGYDRIAIRVAELTGATLDEVRSCLVPTQGRPARYRYQCPSCGQTVLRRKRGTWSCGRCSPTFDPRFILRLIATTPDTGSGTDGP